MALTSAERAKTLVQRLLAFARRQPLQPKSIDIGQLVKGIADLIDSTTGPQVRMLVDVPAELPAAVADANQLEMALVNLAVNARDAMPNGGSITISVRAERIDRRHPSQLGPGDYLRLSVSDTGVGMDEATLKRAIEPFFSTKGIGKGTGLGLSMVHGLAAQLGGGMTISSSPQVGTRVDLWLRVAEQPAEEAGAKAAPAESSATGTVLLVDDEELVRTSTAEMLADLGYAVVQAASAEEALRLVGEGLSPDLLVTDHLMPGMDGVELARTLKNRNPALRPLIISGYAESQGVAPDLPRLEKPFRRAELEQLLASETPVP
jgi:CheY-like chemotaxis protein/two-component sensor histidine kinase